MIIHTNTVEDTIEFGKKLGKLLKANDVILLAGDLGAGKTTMTKGIGVSLGVTRVINSPTFTIVKEYHGNMDLYHLDLYRLESLGSDFDLEEYFNAGGVTVCEWPNNVCELIPDNYLRINIFRESDEGRRLEITAIGERYKELESELSC